MQADDSRSILMITRNFPPLVGGMEKLNYHMFQELSIEYQVAVLGPEGCIGHLPSKGKVWECPASPLPLFLICSTCKSFFAARSLRPKVVLSGSGLTAPMAYLAAKISRASACLYLHGLDIQVKNMLYSTLWPPFFRRFHRVIVNSNFTRRLAEKAGISPSRIHILHPGVELPDLRHSRQKSYSFRRRYDLHNLPIMLYVGRITKRKGLVPFTKDILPKVLETIPQAKLVIVGDKPSSALFHKEDEIRILSKVINQRGLRKSVIFLGSLSEEELSSAYFAADVLVFPVQQYPNDPEGFGMVAVEAAAHGLPTVAFSTGGVSDSVSDSISGVLIPVGDNNAFAEAIIKFLSLPNAEEWHTSCVKFAKRFSWEKFGDKLRKICAE